MATVSPGVTSAAYTAEPQPVGTPQPTRTAVSRSMSSSTFTHEVSEIVDHWEKVPSMHMPPRSLSPLWNRYVPSGRQPSRIVAPRSQRFCWPVEHQRQKPQDGMNEHTT